MGFQSRAMHELQNCSIFGIEIDANAAENARPYCEDLFVGNIESIDLEDILGQRQFDVITFADVLEHLYDPTAALQKVRPYLKEDGYIVASIPNIAHCSVIYELAQGQFQYRSLGLLDDTHIRFFTKSSIYHTFEKAGYLIVSLDRNIAKAADTEFKTNPVTDEDRNFIDYIQQRNPEAETYQYVIKATPLNAMKGIQFELIKAQEELEKIKENNKKYEKTIKKLESDITWITNQKPIKILNFIKKIFKQQ